VNSSADEIARLRAQLIDAQMRHARMGSQLEQRVEWRTHELSIANQRLENANQQLEAFNYMVSHDLRASLRSIDGYLNVLMEDLGPNQTDTVTNDIQQLHASIDRLRTTLSELLKLAQGGHSELDRHHVDLSAMCHEIVAELRLCDPHRLVDVDIAENIGVYANQVLMREVLQNLLTNAWKFTAKRARARIQFGMQQELDNIVYFVRDNGAGFDMQRKDELFLPFHRLHDE
jgi:light-regulated signal transduction histidine kinase (bacteriophytochrome)